MKREELMLAAQKAILEKTSGVNPFAKLSPPVVQIWCVHKLKDFPIPSTYVGQRYSRSEGRNGYIYNLCAYQILQHLERFEQEFDLK